MRLPPMTTFMAITLTKVNEILSRDTIKEKKLLGERGTSEENKSS